MKYFNVWSVLCIQLIWLSCSFISEMSFWFSKLFHARTCGLYPNEQNLYLSKKIREHPLNRFSWLHCSWTKQKVLLIKQPSVYIILKYFLSVFVPEWSIGKLKFVNWFIWDTTWLPFQLILFIRKLEKVNEAWNLNDPYLVIGFEKIQIF